MNNSTSSSNKTPWILGSLAVAIAISSWAVYHRKQGEALVTPSSQKGNTAQAPKPVVKDATPTPEELDATANAKPCDFTVITNLDLSRPPTEGELIAAGNLGEKLTPTRSANADLLTDPVAHKHQQLDNLAFGTAIQAWNDHNYDEALRLFTGHLQSFPDSPWASEAMLHIGCHHQYVARFSESVEWFDKILEIAPKDSEMYHKAKLRRTILNVDLGRLEDATTGFAEMIKEDPSPNHQSYASYWLIQTEFLKKNETALRDCGQKALSQAARILGSGEEANELYQLSAAGPHGFNAQELYTTALQHGLNPTPVQANTALDVLPVPFIAHYQDKHYVTVESVSKDTVKLYDSRISASTDMPRASFEKNWSGFALLLKPAPSNEGVHPAEHLDKIIGGCCGQPAQPADLGMGPDDCISCGLPTYSVNTINMNFKVIDTPMWWKAPVGPSVNMTLLFNSQDSLNNYAPFGGKWAFKYASYMLITPGNRVQVRDGDGKFETFPAPIDGIPTPIVNPITYQSPPGDFRVLTQTALHDFTLTDRDGTVYRYGIPAAMNGLPGGPGFTAPPVGYYIPANPTDPASDTSVPLLLSITDRHNNSVNITHNKYGAITQVSHSACSAGTWNFVYTTVAGSLSRVSHIDDPFGRSCQFFYDAQGNLVNQIDMGGLQYGYTYTNKNAIDNSVGTNNVDPQPSPSQQFVSTITTPTGTTHIETEPADGIGPFLITDAQTADGYHTGYRPHGAAMWTNYRITVKDHIDQPTEYYFSGLYSFLRYVRNPIQMQRAPGAVDPGSGSRTEIRTTLINKKGVINQVDLYAENKLVQHWYVNPLWYDVNTLLSSRIPDGNGGYHLMQYNAKGMPTSIKINGADSNGVPIVATDRPNIADAEIVIKYVDTRLKPVDNGVDVEKITRKYEGLEKVLSNIVYYPNSRDINTQTDVNGGMLTYVWHPDGYSDDYPNKGLPYMITDSVTGDWVTFTYDADLRPYQTFIKDVLVGTRTYNQKGNLLSSLSASGRQSSFEYDNLNRLTKELRSDNSFTAYQWACCYIETTRFGKMVGSNEKTLRRSVTIHDSRVLPLSTIDTEGRTINYNYDIAGRLVGLTDGKNQTTQWKFNDAGQLMKKIYPGSSEGNPIEENFNYDSYGRLYTFKNRRGQVATFDYEYDGKLDHVYGDTIIGYDYDSWRRIYQQNQGEGFGVTPGAYTFAHDLLGRLTSIDGPWANDTVEYAYNDAARAVTRASPGDVSQTTVSDAYGRLKSIDNILGNFANGYDDTSTTISTQLQSITHTGANAGFNTAFTYLGDDFNRALNTITSSKPGGATVAKHTYAYDSLGNIQTWKREAQLANPDPSNNPTSQYQSTIYYDQADQLSSLVNQPLAGSTVANTGYHYTYDPAGNIASKQVEASGTGATMTTYAHNNLNQLTAIGGSAGAKQVIVRGDTDEPATVKVKPSIATEWKDARMLEGNRFEASLDLATGSNQLNIQAKDGSNNVSNYTYGLNLAASTAAVPNYDADGNMLTDGVRSYAWDSRSRLTKITWGGGSGKTTEYRYNALGQRSEQIEKIGTAETGHFYYLYEGIHLLCRYTAGTATGNIDRQYLSQGEQRKSGSAWANYYYNRDHLGSIREVMNSDGSLAARYDYDPYGKRRTQYQLAGYAGGCDLGFTGHITQQSVIDGQGELVLTFFRGYDPEIGKWLSADPIGEAGGMNLYAYADGNPVSLSDPFGLCGESEGGFWNQVGGALESLGESLFFASRDPQGAAAAGTDRIINGTFGGGSTVLGNIEPLRNAGVYQTGSAADRGGEFMAAYATTLGLVAGASEAVSGKGGVNAGENLKTVTSWADEGITPDFSPGRWVQLGKATKTNFCKTGLPGPKLYLNPLKLQRSKVPFTNSVTREVPASSLQWPSGVEKWKGILGQRQIKGGGE